MTAIIIDLELDDFRRLVSGRKIYRTIDGHRIAIRQQGLSARQMMQAVLVEMGDDPIEAEKLVRKRGKK